MKSKIIKCSLLLIIVLLCSACNGDITRDIRHNGYSVSTKFICDDFYDNNKVRYITDNRIIDTEGKIYEISLGQVFSNKQNCKRVDTNIKVKAILDDKIVKGTDNRYYYLDIFNNVSSYSLVLETDNSYELYNLLLKEDDVLKVITADSSKGIYYLLKTDGIIYSYVIGKENYNSSLKIISRTIVYDYGSRIVDFNYSGDEALNTYIRTEDKIYRMKIKNEECSKYADVVCKYEIMEDDVFTKYKDKIIAFNGNVLITDYKQIFTINK